MSLHTQELETIAESSDLLAMLVALRRDVIAEGDTLFARWCAHIQRKEYLESARKMARYLALRRPDLRALQTALMCRGSRR